MKLLKITPLLCLIAAGCAPSIEDTDANGDDTGDGIDNVQNKGGTTTTSINATSYEEWVYMDFESGEIVEVSSPKTDDSWDISFQRFNAKLNGGASGDGGVLVAVVTGEDFDALTTAPSEGYVSDRADEDDDGVPEYAMGGWYNYDSSTHVLTPADLFYVIRTVEGAYVKFQHEAYYDDAGTSGHVKFTWGFIDAPDGTIDTGDDSVDTGEPGGDTGDTGEPGDDPGVDCASGTSKVTTTDDGDGYISVLNSSSSSEWTCMSFVTGEQVQKDLDIAWKQWSVYIPATAKGAVLGGEDYDALTTAPSSGWSTDNDGLFSDWYDYDYATHVLTPQDEVYVLMDTRGDYWKLQITSYYDENDTVHRPTFRWAAIAAP